LPCFFSSANHFSFCSNVRTGQNKKREVEQPIVALILPEGRMPELLVFTGLTVQPKRGFFPLLSEKKCLLSTEKNMNRIFVRKTIFHRFVLTETVSSWGLGFCKKP